MSGLLKRKPATSPERAALAAAVAAAKAAERTRNAAIEAEEKAQHAVWDAKEGLRRAEEALGAARTQATQETVRGLMGDVVEAPVSVAAARRDLEVARDRLDDAIAARDLLNARRHDDDALRQKTSHQLDQAVAAVVAVEATARAIRIAEDVKRLQRELAAKADELIWLVSHFAFPQDPSYTGLFPRPADQELRDAMRRLTQGTASEWADLLPPVTPSASWAAAAMALRSDADATLPSAG